MEKRIIDLEIRYAHLEHQVSELSDVVYRQQQLIDRLKLEMIALKKRLDSNSEGPGQETPPHY
jgi:SlyX protein